MLEAERAHEVAAAECRVAEGLLRGVVETGLLLTAAQHAQVVAAADAHARTGKAFHAATMAHFDAQARAEKTKRAKRRAT